MQLVVLEILAQQVQLGLLVQLEIPVQRVALERPEMQDQQEHQVQQELRVIMVQLVQQERLV